MIIWFLVIGLLSLQLFWIFTDPRPVAVRLKQLKKPDSSVYWLEILLIIPQVFSYYYFPLPFSAIETQIITLGIATFALGWGICVWAKIVMKQHWGPPANFEPRRQTELVTSGPFKFSRNPIYLGLVLVILGASLALNSVFFWLSYILYWYLDKKIKVEERTLVEHFGKKYLVYKNKVRRWI